MMTRVRKGQVTLRISALLVATSLTLPPLLAGCGGQSSPPPPVDDTRGGAVAPAAAPARRQGLSTGQKVVILAGAAALYYMYRKHQKAQANQPQYYLSKNGRVYYRDPQTHQAHWVTPPQNGIAVPADEAQQYSQFQGYNNRPTGQDLTNIPGAAYQ